MKHCPNCNFQMGDEDLFCSECGMKYPHKGECPHCGATVNEDDLFCSNCGAKLDKKEDASHRNKDEYKSELIRYTQTVVKGDTLKPIASSPSQEESKYKEIVIISPKKYDKWIVLSLISIALILIIGGSAYFFLNRSSNKFEEKKEIVANGSKTLYGSIGKYPITMELHIEKSIVDGSLYYNKYGPNNKLFVSGSINNNEIELKEHDKDGIYTGCYKGNYSNGVFQGEYVNHKGNAYSFKLYEDSTRADVSV